MTAATWQASRQHTQPIGSTHQSLGQFSLNSAGHGGMGAAVLPTLLLGAMVPVQPWWLLQPATGSTEQLARAIGWRAFPSAPRTISDRTPRTPAPQVPRPATVRSRAPPPRAGNEVEGHCLPTALLDQLQLNGGAGQWPSGRDLSAVVR